MDGIFKVLKRKNKYTPVSQEIYIWQNYPSKMKVKIKLTQMTKLANMPYKKMPKEGPQANVTGF